MYEKEELHDSFEEIEVDPIDECTCDGDGLPTAARWGDADDIVDDRICVKCARIWSTTQRRPSMTDGAPCSSFELSKDVSPEPGRAVRSEDRPVSLSVVHRDHSSAQSGSFDLCSLERPIGQF